MVLIAATEIVQDCSICPRGVGTTSRATCNALCSVALRRIQPKLSDVRKPVSKQPQFKDMGMSSREAVGARLSRVELADQTEGELNFPPTTSPIFTKQRGEAYQQLILPRRIDATSSVLGMLSRRQRLYVLNCEKDPCDP